MRSISLARQPITTWEIVPCGVRVWCDTKTGSREIRVTVDYY
jgi:hypothetical protein